MNSKITSAFLASLILLCAIPLEAASLGKNPAAGVIRDPDGAYYGPTANGGTYDLGTVFRVDSNGHVSTLLNFTGAGGSALGAVPLAPLIIGNDGNLYGTTSEGGGK